MVLIQLNQAWGKAWESEFLASGRRHHILRTIALTISSISITINLLNDPQISLSSTNSLKLQNHIANHTHDISIWVS